MSKRPNNTTYYLLIFACVLCVLLGLLLPVAFMMSNPDLWTTEPTGTTNPSTTVTTPPPTTTVPPTTPPPTDPPVVKESSFTLSATGDMLMHMPVVNTGKVGTGYDFDPLFTYFTQYVQKADYAVCNLETTLAGLDNGYKYSGYPQFNCPDEIIDGAKNAGFDMILTANNHSYDTRRVGMLRTLEIIKDRGLDVLGTRPDAEAPDYLIVERNGISLGLMCYTYEDNADPNIKAPNWITMKPEDAPLLNTFDYQNADLFYEEVRENMAEMKASGADAVVMFIHWGYEYQLKQHESQEKVAQGLCDLGVDVIIGGHPHVVQPVELLQSNTDDTHKTVCLYSMGNAVSNQRLGNISSIKTPHTEDGVLFSVTFTRYSDGTVILESADLLPTWVYLGTNPAAERWTYNILPLDDTVEDWKTLLPFSDAVINSAKASYDRTMAIVGEGMAEVDSYLAQNLAETEALLGVK